MPECNRSLTVEAPFRGGAAAAALCSLEERPPSSFAVRCWGQAHDLYRFGVHGPPVLERSVLSGYNYETEPRL